MSADNGIYILETPDGNGNFEYRVIHAQAIENIYWDDNCPSHNNSEGNPTQVVNCFGKCNLLTSRENAYLLAQGMEKEILADEFCPILEYGIGFIELPHPFSYYLEKANKTKES